MKAFTAVLILFPSLALPGQSDSDWLYDLEQFYTKESVLCLGVPDWPTTVRSAQPSWASGRLLALADAGLAKATRQGKTIVFSLTAAGRKSQNVAGDLCYGRFQVKKIIRTESEEKNSTIVYFTYRIKDVKPWTYQSGVRTAFSELDNLIAGSDSKVWRALFSAKNGGSQELTGYPTSDELDY